MDALAVGLILLVLSSLVMAHEQREKRLLAGIAVALGCGICGFFVFGLRWL
jgi:UDP-N-acetylmuramyl pentapeptide phosphotransferase/UDP-N-acetylglucosamine-1-phosphate transferase